jgi:hypothetical protein
VRLDLDQVQIVIIALAKLAEMDQRKMADAGVPPARDVEEVAEQIEHQITLAKRIEDQIIARGTNSLLETAHVLGPKGEKD